MHTEGRSIFWALRFDLCGSGGAWAVTTTKAAPSDATCILTNSSPWAWRFTLRQPVVSVEAFQAAGLVTNRPAKLPDKAGDMEATAGCRVERRGF